MIRRIIYQNTRRAICNSIVEDVQVYIKEHLEFERKIKMYIFLARKVRRLKWMKHTVRKNQSGRRMDFRMCWKDVLMEMVSQTLFLWKITGRKNTSCFRQIFLSINIAYFSAAKKFYSCGGLRLAYRVIIKEILNPTATTTSKISNSKKAIAAIPNAGQPSPFITTPYFPYSIRRIPQDTLQWQT